MNTAHEVRAAALGRIEALLGRANGRRRERKLTLGTILALIEDVVPGRDWSCEDGGTVANAYKQAAVTTLALAARVGGVLHVGITVAAAKSTSPGRAWGQLQPWRSGQGPAGDAAAKWAAWAAAGLADGTVIALDDMEVDAILEGMG